MSARSEPDDDDVLDYDTLFELRGDDGDYEGPLDHPCPLCGPELPAGVQSHAPSAADLEAAPGFITYYCARCEAKGYAHADAECPWWGKKQPCILARFDVRRREPVPVSR